MNILVAVNHLYLEALKNMLFSLYCNTGGNHTIYCPYRNLSVEDIEELRLFVSKECHAEFVPIILEEEFLKDAYVHGHFTVEVYYRIFVSKLVPDSLERILWLDADLVVDKDITEFYEQDFQGKSLIVCREQLVMMNNFRNEELGLSENVVYFNSGVILFNLAKIRNYFDEEKVAQMIREKRDILLLPDQDILNILYCGDVLYAPDEMNYQFYQYFEKRYKHLDKRNKDAVIYHFVGSSKPWKKIYKFNRIGSYYWKYQWKQKRYLHCIYRCTCHIICASFRPVTAFWDRLRRTV